MSGNRSTRRKLEQLCGGGCFFKRAKIAERIEMMGGIRTFKSFVAEKRFTGKKISKQITFHHLRHKSEGGTTTIENGANVEEIAHQYMHSLPREQEEIINNMLRSFKLTYGIISTKGIDETGIAEIDFQDDDYLVIPAYNTTEADLARRYKKENERKKKEKYQRLKKPNRAMLKRELQDLIDEVDDEEWKK